MNTQIQNIKLYQIAINPNNPRKNFNQDSLAELAESIKAQGVIQPIMLRPKGEDMFEIIYGERRCRATALAGLDTIPAIIQEGIAENQVAEIALIENMQREDITPLEEHYAYLRLIEKCGYDVELLMSRFSKSESYIQSRLKLSELLPEFRDSLLSEDINLTIALELCKYSTETQVEIFESHYSADHSHQNWSGMSAKRVVEMLTNSYSTKLDDYFFDKTECYGCNFNSEQVSLFAECASCGRCMNRACLNKKNVDYIVERAITSYEQNPELPLAHTKYQYNESAVEELTAKGYEVEVISYCQSCPVAPTAPNQDDYTTTEEYEEAVAEYNEECIEFSADSTEIAEKYQDGRIKIYARIETKGVALYYVTLDNSNSTDGSQTALEKLQTQDARFKEIAIEKTIDDTKKLVSEVNVSVGELSAIEETMVYFAMLKKLRRENFAKVGLSQNTHYLSDTERFEVCQRLTEEIKTIIKRDFILDTLKDAQRGNSTATMLTLYAQQHTPDKHNEIQATHNEVYEKRHARINEKIETLKNTIDNE